MASQYCLDANVLIEAWQKYYNPRFCPEYWNVLNELGKNGVIFIPEQVRDEIIRTEDDLSKWLKVSDISIKEITGPVTRHLRNILETYPQLVDNTKSRSLADPWVIAHAMHESAIVVTKEEKVTAVNSKKLKIPNVCEHLGVNWVNDFQFIEASGITFRCFIS